MATSSDLLFALEVDGVDAPLRVVHVVATEEIHRPYRYAVAIERRDALGETRVGAEELIAKEAKLTFAIGVEGEPRTIEGIVHEATESHGQVQIVIVPQLGLMADAVDHRVFVDVDTVAIVTEVLAAHGVTAKPRVLRALTKRPQCVQAFESDLAFVQRLCAEEGIVLHHKWDEPSTVHLVDHVDGHDPLPAGGAVGLTDSAGLIHGEGVFRATLRRTLTSDKVSLRDYDFTNPPLDQKAEADAGTAGRERYEYPGFYVDPGEGALLAGLRLDAYRARGTELSAETSLRRLVPGYVLELTTPDDRYAGKYLVVSASFEAGERRGGKPSFEARFTAIPQQVPFRPPRPASPRLGGIQTATVTGSSGSEIHTEEHGRVKVHMRWDRVRPLDDTSSTWCQVVQPPTSGGFFLPRVGWEALVSFHERSADVPLVVGRVYNGVKVPPSSLPGKKVASAFGTLTTPGGGSTNGITMDDAAGNELMSIVASKDMNEHTTNDKNIAVTSNDTLTVGASSKTITGQVFDVVVGGAQSYSVGGSREVNITANKVVNAASEKVMVGAARIFDVGGDHVTNASSVLRLVGAAKAELGIEHVNRAVQGAATTLIGGTWSVVAGTTNNINVSGASTELVGGVKSITSKSYYANVKGALAEAFASRKITAGGDREESFGAAASYGISGATTMQGADVTVTATARLKLEAGGVTVTMTPGSIEISGDFKGVQGTDDGKVDYE